jgi:lincosamide nucleotidyltransferase A/C/D/E
MEERSAATSEVEVVAVLEWLTARGVTYQVNGGWGVDALVGRRTRSHRDLDVFVDELVVAELLQWLRSREYEVVEDWLPVRIELASPLGRVDVHPMAIQTNGDGIQQGLDGQTFLHSAADRTTGHIGGREVVVGSRTRLIELRQGYAPRPEDLHDLAQLAALET